jgi:hypothetical protein
MRLYLSLFFVFLSFSSLAEAFELIMIQAVSQTKKTFITRHGRRNGLTEGVTGTFTANDISLLAKAVMVTGEFTHWQVINEDLRLPFDKGAIVTYYPTTEHIWALAPEEERKKYIRSEATPPRTSLTFRGAITRGLSESTSDAPVTTTTRGGFLSEIYFEKDFTYKFSWDIGLRYEREVVNYPGGSLLTARSLAIVDLYYYFDQFRELLDGGYIYVGTGLGYGLSNTTAVTLTQSGPVALLPIVKLGMELPFNYEWSFLGDVAFESLQTKEEQGDGRIQTTTQTNAKFGIGLRRTF